MASKALILLGLFAFLLVVSEMAAAGTVKLESEETVQPDQYDQGAFGSDFKRQPCRRGCCYKGNRGCSRCCTYAGETVQTQPGH